MNASESSIPNLRRAVCHHAALARVILIVLAAVIATSCAHRDPDQKKKKRRPKDRDPIEQKVFYNGWWPR